MEIPPFIVFQKKTRGYLKSEIIDFPYGHHFMMSYIDSYCVKKRFCLVSAYCLRKIRQFLRLV